MVWHYVVVCCLQLIVTHVILRLGNGRHVFWVLVVIVCTTTDAEFPQRKYISGITSLYIDREIEGYFWAKNWVYYTTFYM